MGLKRRHFNSGSSISRIESLESREFFSATLVQITIPTSTPVKVVHKPAKKPVVKPAVKHKPASGGGEQHTNIGYQIFAG
jgi:hypothetical protein